MKKKPEKKSKEDKVDPFSPRWVDEIYVLIDARIKAMDGVLKSPDGQGDLANYLLCKAELRREKREIKKVLKLIDRVWDGLREIMAGRIECLNAFESWKSIKIFEAVKKLDEKIQKDYWPLYEAMVKEPTQAGKEG